MEHVIEVHGLVTRFGDHIVHDNLDFTVQRGEIMGIIGGAGSGKSVLMWTVLGLKKPSAGQVKILGLEVDHHNPSTT